MKKVLALILICIMCLSVFAACVDDKKEDADTKATVADTKATDAITKPEEEITTDVEIDEVITTQGDIAEEIPAEEK